MIEWRGQDNIGACLAKNTRLARGILPQCRTTIYQELFGGEGLFLTTLTGPGKIWLQSLPLSRLAGRILANAVRPGGGKDEGSLLGGIGNLMMGDRS